MRENATGTGSLESEDHVRSPRDIRALFPSNPTEISLDEATVTEISTAPGFENVLFLLVAWLVAVCTFVLFLTGASTCWKIHKTRSTQDCAFLPMLAVFVNTLSWMIYGHLTNDRLMVAVYIWGLICMSIYIAVYYTYAHSTDVIQKQILCTVIICLLAWTFYRHHAITPKHQVFYSGASCIVTSIVADASPFISMMEVIQSKSTACLSSFSQSCLSLAVSLEWLVYGYLDEDLALQVTYLIGALLNGTLVGLYFKYPREKSIVDQEKYSIDMDNLF